MLVGTHDVNTALHIPYIICSMVKYTALIFSVMTVNSEVTAISSICCTFTFVPIHIDDLLAKIVLDHTVLKCVYWKLELHRNT